MFIKSEWMDAHESLTAAKLLRIKSKPIICAIALKNIVFDTCQAIECVYICTCLDWLCIEKRLMKINDVTMHNGQVDKCIID